MDNKTKIIVVLILSIAFIIGCTIIGNDIKDGLTQIGIGILNS